MPRKHKEAKCGWFTAVLFQTSDMSEKSCPNMFIYVPHMLARDFRHLSMSMPSDKDRVIMPSGTTRTHASVAAANCRSQAGSERKARGVCVN